VRDRVLSARHVRNQADSALHDDDLERYREELVEAGLD